MKHIGKKLIMALLLTVALTAGMATAAFANTSTGNAGVDFTEGNSPEIIDPPSGGEFDPYATGNLYFGSHPYTTANETHPSVDSAGEQTGRTTGVLIANGMSDGFRVTIKRTNFSDDNGPTLNGAVLRLITEGSPQSTAGNTSPSPTAENKVINTAETTIFSATENQGMGVWGNIWTGELDVIGGTMSLGHASAILTWEIQNGL